VATSSTRKSAVSAGNPCPFLRALVAEGALADDTEPLDRVVSTIVQTAQRGDGHPVLPAAAIYGIALMANGLGPLTLLRNRRQGLRLNALRGGPLDKRGVGSGILDDKGKIDPKQLARLEGFASPKAGPQGKPEPGLDLREIRAFMDANFERAAGRRRRIDRALMNGEWPVLLKVLGKQGGDGTAGPGTRYLAVADIRRLFVDRRLPARMAR
jgi:hypothetical protein